MVGGGEDGETDVTIEVVEGGCETDGTIEVGGCGRWNFFSK